MDWSLDEILSNCTITDYRSVSGSSSTTNYVHDVDMMNLTSSVDIFQKEAHLIIQPKFETPIVNFTNVTNIDPDNGASTKGMWHQKGVVETDNTKGIFLGALDVDGSVSLADLLGVDKGLKKIGVLPDDGEKVMREAVVAIPVIKKYNNRTKRIETKFINVNKNTVKRALSSINSGQPATNVPASVYSMVRSMMRYVVPPKFDFLTQLKKFGSKKFRPFAMYFFEFEHEFSQNDIANIWQNLPPKIGTSAKKEQVSICHSIARDSGELLTIKELKNPDLHWMVFKVKQKAKWNYFDKVIDLAGQLPPRPDAGIAPISVQMGDETEAPPEIDDCGRQEINDLQARIDELQFMTTSGTTTTGDRQILLDEVARLRGEIAGIRQACADAPSANSSHGLTHVSATNQITGVSRMAGIRDIARYARQESDVASGYGLDYSYNWPYDFCSLVELIKVDTEIHLGGGDSIQIAPTIGPDGKEETVVVTGKGAKRVVSDDIREEAPNIPFSGWSRGGSRATMTSPQQLGSLTLLGDEEPE
jgi:hypothetical protein